jgi:hypothetical protein
MKLLMVFLSPSIQTLWQYLRPRLFTSASFPIYHSHLSYYSAECNNLCRLESVVKASFLFYLKTEEDPASETLQFYWNIDDGQSPKKKLQTLWIVLLLFLPQKFPLSTSSNYWGHVISSATKSKSYHTHTQVYIHTHRHTCCLHRQILG